MKKLLTALAVLVLALSAGCGGRVIPLAPSGEALIYSSDRSIAIERDGVLVRVRVQDPVLSAFGTDPFCSFHILFKNSTYKGFRISTEHFVIEDDSGRVHKALRPQVLQALLSPQTQYLLPYPYIGYYYLPKIEMARANVQFESPLKYSGNEHGRDILEEALPEGPVLPAKQVEGLIYFPLDLLALREFRLKIFLNPSGGGTPDWTFPFLVER